MARALRHAVVSRLARTLGSANKAVQRISRVTACRRKLNTSSATLPRGTVSVSANEHAQLYSVNDTKAVLHLHGVGNAPKKAKPVGKAQATIYLAPPCLHAALRGVGSAVVGAAACLAVRRGNKSASQRERTPNAALPNPSLKLSPNGGPRGPGRRYPVHSRQPGPRVPPSVPT